MSSRTSAFALFAVATLLQACTFRSLGDYCNYSNSSSLPESDTTSLGVVLGAPPDRIGDSPYIRFYTPSVEKSDVTLELKLIPAQLPLPDSLDESPCGGLDWRTYRVTTDSDQWRTFWSLPRPLAISTVVGPLDSMAPLRSSRFAFAFVNTATAEVIMSCGCYWT